MQFKGITVVKGCAHRKINTFASKGHCMAIRNNLKNLRDVTLDIIYTNYIKVSWDRGTNFGDAFNPFLLEVLVGRKVRWVNYNYSSEHLMCAGSILHKANSNAIIWGSGFMSEDAHIKYAPKKICAVRGPRTRSRLLELNLSCPEVYGDPALLIPLIYKPKINKKYKLGIVPHYTDKDNPLLSNLIDQDILILNITMEDHYKFIDDLLSCEMIISSSLHGIILADAYNIPSIWVEFSDKVKGHGFKFLDYFLSVNRMDRKPFKITKDATLNNLYNLFYEYEINIDLDALIESCPYKIKKQSNQIPPAE